MSADLDVGIVRGYLVFDGAELIGAIAKSLDGEWVFKQTDGWMNDAETLRRVADRLDELNGEPA